MNLGVLISGRGSNLEAIVRAHLFDPGWYPSVTVVISNNPMAAGMRLSCLGDTPIHVIPDNDPVERERSIRAIMDSYQLNCLALAGFMRVLTAEFCNDYEGKILNIHPSLLPKYKGLNTHKRVLEAGNKQHGCSVHYVTRDLDSGPIIAQSVIDVEDNDTPETLATRVLEKEHILYPSVLAQLHQKLVVYKDGMVYYHNDILNPFLIF